MGKKYIIELCEKPMKNENGEYIWRVKGFNTLVFDQIGLDKLEEYKKPITDIHQFEVGDVFYIPGEFEDHKLIITRKTPYTIEFMESGGAVWSRLRNLFDEQAVYSYHSDIFESLIKRDFT